MHVVINQADALFGVDAESKLFAPATETITFDVTFNSPQATLQGLSVALLSPDGETLAHSLIEEKRAILDTNTAQAVDFIKGASIGTEKMVFLAIGESTSPVAVLAVSLSPNPLADIAPPAALAPTYPTSESLRAILSQMTAQADRAEDAVKATEKAQKAVAQYVDVTFPAKATEAEKTLNNATTSGVNSVTQRANQAVYELNQKQTQIEASIDIKVTEANAALDGKLATANTAINEAVGKAEQAKSDAVKAQGEASKSAEQAGESASNASTSAEQAEQAKTAIGDVGGRLNAVETSVAGKQPYISQFLSQQFDYKRYDFTVGRAAFFVRSPCHEGFIAFAQYQHTQSVYFGVNGKKIPFPVNARDGFRLTIVGDNKTEVYAEHNGKHRFTIGGRGDSVSIAHETLEAFPENIGSYSYIIGWRTANGYIVTSNGLILKGTPKVNDEDLNEFAEVGTFAFNKNYTEIVKGAMLKIGDTFRYKDATTHKLTEITIGDDGAPSFNVNNYAQNTAINFYPLDSFSAVAEWHSRVVGITNGNGHLYDNTGGDDTFLGVARVKNTRLLFTYNDVYLVWTGGTSDGGYERYRVASNLLMQDDTSYKALPYWRAITNFVADASGNIFIVYFFHYDDRREFVHVFKNKEA